MASKPPNTALSPNFVSPKIDSTSRWTLSPKFDFLPQSTQVQVSIIEEEKLVRLDQIEEALLLWSLHIDQYFLEKDKHCILRKTKLHSSLSSYRSVSCKIAIKAYPLSKKSWSMWNNHNNNAFLNLVGARWHLVLNNWHMYLRRSRRKGELVWGLRFYFGIGLISGDFEIGA